MITAREKEAMTRVWEKMADADLGSWISPKAWRIAKLFRDLREVCDDRYATNEVDESIAPMIRGFLFNHRPDSQDFSMTMCLDLHCIECSGDGIYDLMQYILYNCRPYETAPHNWAWIYQNLLRDEAEARKTKKR